MVYFESMDVDLGSYTHGPFQNFHGLKYIGLRVSN
jgi:hypothetical protein